MKGIPVSRHSQLCNREPRKYPENSYMEEMMKYTYKLFRDN